MHASRSESQFENQLNRKSSRDISKTHTALIWMFEYDVLICIIIVYLVFVRYLMNVGNWGGLRV